MIDGILNIDKPGGMTSHDVVQRVRRVAGQRRVGHAGTLDPLATGVLVVCLGKATRLVEYLVGQPKTYAAVIRLGQSTNTYDADGEIVNEAPVTATEADIAAELPAFCGEIEQVPPMYSAIKRDGKPLYTLARQGIEVERDARQVTIYDLQLVAYRPPDLQLRVVCSAGTYIRSLAHDLGQALGCGGHISSLRRLSVGRFSVDAAVELPLLTANNLADNLYPMDDAVRHLPRLVVPSPAVNGIRQGRQIPRRPDHPIAQLVRVYSSNDEFIGLLEAKGAQWQPKKVLT